ncbi:MAG: tRNA (cytidine(34)-2'-O)-methyltransferase [Pseudobdellovibrionaceae bacterium]
MNTAHPTKPALALFQPDIPQNVGAAMRLCACLGVKLHIIFPCGFLWKDDAFRRTGMDYRDHVDLVRHISWDEFLKYVSVEDKRVILLTTKTDLSYTRFDFTSRDILLMGRESAGVPEDVHETADARITIPMHGTMRSMNVINAASLVFGEALRQTGNV